MIKETLQEWVDRNRKKLTILKIGNHKLYIIESKEQSEQFCKDRIESIELQKKFYDCQMGIPWRE